MRKQHCRITAGFLFAAMFISSVVSCGGGTENSSQTQDVTGAVQTETTEAVEETPKTPLYEMEKQDFGGRDFRISVIETYVDEMWVEEINGDICNDAVYQRNALIEDYFNVKIKALVTQQLKSESQVEEIQRNLMAGDDVYDLTAVYTYLAGRPVLEGLYHDWNDVPVVDFSREWWVQSANEAFSINGRRYVAVGDLSITTLLLSYGVFFNQQIVKNQDMPDLYQLVLDGKWTIDQLITLSKDLYQDMNNNGKADADDMFGFAADKVTNLDAYTAAFDIPLIALDQNGLPSVALDIGRFERGVEKVLSLYYDTTTYVNGDVGSEIDVFAAGHAAFLTTWMNNAFTVLRDMKDDYGILPYPKLDETQEQYYSNSMDNYSLLSVPKTVEDLNFVGTVVEGLTRESHTSVVPAYYNVALTDKYARDAQSVAMLDIIMNGRQYDFSILHGGKLADFPYLFRNLIASKNKNAASRYAKIQAKIEANLQDLIATYQGLDS